MYVFQRFGQRSFVFDGFQHLIKFVQCGFEVCAGHAGRRSRSAGVGHFVADEISLADDSLVSVVVTGFFFLVVTASHPAPGQRSLHVDNVDFFENTDFRMVLFVGGGRFRQVCFRILRGVFGMNGRNRERTGQYRTDEHFLKPVCHFVSFRKFDIRIVLYYICKIPASFFGNKLSRYFVFQILQDINADGGREVVFSAAGGIYFGDKRVKRDVSFPADGQQFVIKFPLNGNAGIVPAGNNDGFFKHCPFSGRRRWKRRRRFWESVWFPPAGCCCLFRCRS